MRDSENVFHLAIPTHNLDLCHDFYIKQLGCKLARRYNDRMTIDFFGDQVVCHYDPDYEIPEVKMYPRHFGITFREKAEYDALLQLCVQREIKFFDKPFNRFKGRVEEHETFFIVDPSNNLLEFKYYHDPRMMY